MQINSSNKHSPEFKQKHKNRMKKQLEKLADLEKEYQCEEVDHTYFKVFKVTISSKMLAQLKIQDINRGEDIGFEIIVSEDYPFIMAQIICTSKLPLIPKINDRRNLIQDIIDNVWSPAVIIKSAIQKIPSFLKIVYQNRSSKQYLHNLGSFIQNIQYFKQDIINCPTLNCFQCIQTTKNLFFIQSNTKSLLCLSETFLLIFEIKQKQGIIVLNKCHRLRSNISIQQKNDRIEIITQQPNSQILKRTFKFDPSTKTREFSLIYKHMKQSATAKDQIVGNITKFTRKVLTDKINTLESKTQKYTEQQFQQLKNCLSDMIQICSITDEEQVETYKQKLVTLFKKQQI